MKKDKVRLDRYLSEKFVSKPIEQAKKEIIAGWVKVEGETVRDPSRVILSHLKVTVERPGGDFVSRGGEKLSKAIKKFNLSLTNLTAADLGASTGGFTHCILKNGAIKVYSIDVGYGQLDFSLRQDRCVVVMERTNVKNLAPKDFNENIDFVSVDLSFVSIVSIFNKICELFPRSFGIILIKPQFEAENIEQVKGVVRKKEYHISILQRVIFRLIEMGMSYQGITFSPIKGPAGNIEFLVYFDFNKETRRENISDEISDIVEMAHKELN